MSRTSFVLHKTAILFDTFVSTVIICSLHVKFSSMITPRNFVCDTCSMFVPFKVMFTVDLYCIFICKHDKIGFVHIKRSFIKYISSFSSSLLTVHAVSKIFIVE